MYHEWRRESQSVDSCFTSRIDDLLIRSTSEDETFSETQTEDSCVREVLSNETVGISSISSVNPFDQSNRRKQYVCKQPVTSYQTRAYGSLDILEVIRCTKSYTRSQVSLQTLPLSIQMIQYPMKDYLSLTPLQILLFRTILSADLKLSFSKRTSTKLWNSEIKHVFILSQDDSPNTICFTKLT